MNDRVSAVPPAEFLHGPDAMDADDYEKQFALDWKPPDLDLEGTYNNASSSASGGNRNSFVSTRSGLTRTGTGASGSVWSKAPKQHGSSSTMASSVVGAAGTGAAPAAGPGGFFSRVGGRFSLTRSKSSFDVHDVEEEEGNGGSGGGLGQFIPPVFKHKRSESVNSGAMSSAFFKREAVDMPEVLSKKSTKGAPRPFSTSAGGGTAAPPAGGPVLPGFDPTRRPTRDEITANYQSLLASGFFGTHAIQSTRFAAPGQRGEQQQQTPKARESEASSYFVHRVSEEEDDEPVMQEASHPHPPSPERQPPPPPPNRLAPPPPPPPAAPSFMDMDTDSTSTSEAIPVSPTILFHPTLSQQRPSSECMPPPPTPPNPGTNSKRKPDHKSNLSFSAVPYSSTRPGIEPSLVERPFRSPPISIARFSLESTGRGSYDLQQEQQPPPQRALRGIKRPFTTAANGSQTSFATMATPKGSMDYHRDSDQYGYNYAGNNGNSFTAGIAEEDKPESGARKLVKKLRKSASRISMDLSGRRQVSISRMAPPPDFVDNSNDDDDKMMDDCQENKNNTATTAITNQAPAARTSLSSTVRRSFSWKFGKLGKDNTTTNNAVESQGGKNGGGGFFFHNNSNAPGGFVLNNTDLNRTITSASNAPDTLQHQQATTTTPANPLSNFSFLTSGNDEITTNGIHQLPHESHLKLRGRRLRKHGSPPKQSPSVMKDLPTPPPASPTKDITTPSMDWQQQQQGNTSPQRSPARLRKVNRSRSRSRSNVIRVLHDHHSRPGATEHGTTTDGMPATLTTSLSFSASSKPSSRDANNGVSSHSNDNNNNNMMEGVEFSFHLPGRMRPTSSTNNTAAASGGSGPLAVVPDTNRGMTMGTPTGGITTTTTATMKEMMIPRYSGRWVDEEDQEDMIF